MAAAAAPRRNRHVLLAGGALVLAAAAVAAVAAAAGLSTGWRGWAAGVLSGGCGGGAAVAAAAARAVGGAMSGVLSAATCALRLAVAAAHAASRWLSDTVVSLVLLVAFFCQAPQLLAAGLSWCLTNVVLFHPFSLGCVSLAFTFSAYTGRLYVRLVADDVGFGNPPGFPTGHFVTARRVEAEASVSLAAFVAAHWRRFVAAPATAARRARQGLSPADDARLRAARAKTRAARTQSRSAVEAMAKAPLTAGRTLFAGAIALASSAHAAAWTVTMAVRRVTRGAERVGGRSAMAAVAAVGGGGPPDVDGATAAAQSRARTEEQAFLGCFRIERLQIHGVGLCFETGPGGEFNVNGVTRSVACGDLRRLGVLGHDMTTWPNKVCVHVLRARGLLANDVGGTSDVKLVIQCRHHKVVTAVQYKTLSPLWNQSFELCMADPSAVVHFALYDVGMVSKDKLLAQWHITLKMLLLKHGGKMSGWQTLRDRNGVRYAEPTCGEIDIRLEYVYEEGFVARSPKPPSLSAMAQMDMNSQETAWRIADFQNAKLFLDERFPYLFDIRALEIDDVHFRMKELFARGSEAAAELDERQRAANDADEAHDVDEGGFVLYDEGDVVLTSLGRKDVRKERKRRRPGGRSPSSRPRAIDRAVVHVPRLELTRRKHFRPRPDRPGCSVWELLAGLTGIIPQVIQPDVLGRATHAMLAGVLSRPLSLKGATVAVGDQFLNSVERAADAAAHAGTHLRAKLGGKVGTAVGESSGDDALQSASLGPTAALVRKPRGRHRWKRRLLERRGASVFYKGVRSQGDDTPTPWLRKFELGAVTSVEVLVSSGTSVIQLIDDWDGDWVGPSPTGTEATASGVQRRSTDRSQHATEVKIVGIDDDDELALEVDRWREAFVAAVEAERAARRRRAEAGERGADPRGVVTRMRSWLRLE